MSSSHIFAELCLNLLAADEQHESHAVWSHRRRYTLRLSCEVIRPDQHDEERSAIPMAGSSSADVLTPGVVGDKRQPEDQSVPGQKDHWKVLHRQCLTSRGKQANHLSQKTACLEGCVPGATDGSMPVGSGRVFMQLSSIYRTNVLCIAVYSLRWLSCLCVLTHALQ
jgi:hypothetical protein